MPDVVTLRFKKEYLHELHRLPHGEDWPVVYLIRDDKEMYIGETIDMYNRAQQHLQKEERTRLDTLDLIYDDHFNKSATLDIESWLIQYIAADGRFRLQNGNAGLRNHSYFDRDRYKAKFETLWKKLQEHNVVKNDLSQIRNSDLFKYSPYKSLTSEQMNVAALLQENLRDHSAVSTIIVQGRPGTGKTILATYLMKRLRDNEATKDLNIGIVVAMTSLRNTLKRVFKNVSGLSANMVVGPAEVVGKNYDMLIVDEAHRLRKRKNITNYATHDEKNRQLGLDKTGTELDWIIRSSKKQILFYDENQSVRPSDVDAKAFQDLKTETVVLENQMRVKGGKDYLNIIDDVFVGKKSGHYTIADYDFKIYSDLAKMVADIKQKNKDVALSRMVAGYAWSWKSKNDPKAYDIEIDGVSLRWNSTNDNWVNSLNAINEVGCIHTVQGYEFNYTGVIVGPELSFDPQKNEFVIKEMYYRDRNGLAGVSDSEELKRYIINIYKTLLTRGIEGTYVYFCDKEVEKVFVKRLGMYS